MNARKQLIGLVVFLAYCFQAGAQKISYSEPDRNDNKRTSFDIIGRVGGNILVYKNNRSDYQLTVYDDEMKALRSVDLNPERERWINVDFIPYADVTWMIYQYQQKNIVYCMAVKIDGEGKMLHKPLELDTTRIGWAATNKIYTTVYSDNKKQIMVFKINSRNPKNFLFTTLLFDENLHPRYRHQLSIPMEERNDYFTDFLLDNNGGLVFGKFVRKGGGNYIRDLSLVTKPAEASQFTVHDMKTGDRVLDDIMIKVDNTNDRYLFTALYYRQRRGNIDGLYAVVWDRNESRILKEMLLPFSDELREQAKGRDENARTAMNNYFIRDIIVRKDGGFLLAAESQYTSSRGGGPFNRWDYLGWNNPWASPFNSYYYSPYYYSYGMPWNRYGNNSTRFHAENIMILSFNDKDALEWSNVITKSQFDDQSDGLISYQLMNTGGQLHFLFNIWERRSLLLNDQSIGADGKVTRHPTLKNLNRNIEFMPRYGKQVSARSIIMPCQYRNYLIFAKIDF